jgi:hypothetical protein
LRKAALKIVGSIACAWLTAACVLGGVGPVVGSTVLAGSSVAAVGMHRQVTGDCWGACQIGTMCDRDSGLCVPKPCNNECRYDEKCESGRCVRRSREAPPSGGDDPPPKTEEPHRGDSPKGDSPKGDDSTRDPPARDE